MESKKGACSAHVEPAKGNCLKHNRREGRIPSYVNPHLTSTNRTVYEDDAIKYRKSIVPLKKRAEMEYTKKTGQKWQEKTVPFREDVLKLKPGITDAQLLEFKDKVEALTGWKVMGIWLHLDEGHVHSKYIEGDEDFEINYHAHVLYDCIDHETGKAIRLQRKYFCLRQDLLGAVTGMERGNPASLTGRKHRKTAEQRKQAEEARIAKLAEVAERKRDAIQDMDGQIAEKSNTLAGLDQAIADRNGRMKSNALNTLDKVLSFFGQSEKDEEIRGLREDVKDLQETIAQEPERVAAAVTKAAKAATKLQRQADKEKIDSLQTQIAGLNTRTAAQDKEIDTLTEEVSAWRITAEALKNWLSVGMAEIKSAVDAIIRRTSSPTCKHFSEVDKSAVDVALGTDADISSRKDRADALMGMAQLALLKKHVPAAWMASTTEEVMGIAGREDHVSAEQSHGLRR